MEDGKNNSSELSDMEKLLIQNSSMMDDIQKLWVCVHNLSAEVKSLKEEKDDLALEVTELNAYNRRSNIELRNIPESVKDSKLEDYCLDVLAKMEIELSSYEIVACHRLGKYKRDQTRSVIVRFTNRKYADDAIYWQRSLKNTKFKDIFITENLCPTNRKISSILYKAKKGNKINSVWTRHGLVSAKMEMTGETFKVKTIESAELFVETSSVLRNSGHTKDNHPATVTKINEILNRSDVENPVAMGPNVEAPMVLAPVVVAPVVVSPEVVAPEVVVPVVAVPEVVVPEVVVPKVVVPEVVVPKDVVLEVVAPKVVAPEDIEISPVGNDLLLNVLKRVTEDGVYPSPKK